MKYVLIVLFLAILAFTIIKGYKDGFLKTLVSMLAIIISIVIVWLFSSSITQLIDSNTGLRQTVHDSVYERLLEKSSEEKAATDEEQKQAVEKYSLLPDSILTGFEETVNPFGTVNDYNSRLADYVANLSVKACGIIVTLVVAFIVLKTLMLVTGVINKIPLLGMPNRIMGAVLGMGRGLIAIWIVCFVITLLSSTQLGQSCMSAIAESKILSLFYDGVLSFGEVMNKL